MPRWADWIGKNRDLLFVVAVIAIMLTIFVPLPAIVLDFLLVVSITLSILVLLTVVYTREPIKFSVFPSLLLLTTAYRLALNVATTRRILANAGTDGTAAAGSVVEAFGNFVAASEPVIGLVIFAILVIVNFVVITKGATRVSEVGARFTLDAMPGKQMAIDADLNAGLINESEARDRRTQVAREADFYGAMDGASKFVRGDAIAGILITLVNIVAGFALGMVKYGMTAGDALSTFTILTIGDGLVSQVPALIVSLAAGLIVTRATSESNLGREFLGQVLGDRRAIKVAIGFLGALFLTTIFMGSGLPGGILLVVGGGMGLLVLMMGRSEKEARRSEAARREKAAADAPREPEKVEGLLRVDPMELEIGVGLVRLADPKKGGALLDEITRIRRAMAVELGIVVPPVRILDNMKFAADAYVIKVRGIPVAEGVIRAGKVLAIDLGSTTGPVSGEKTTDPAFGSPAWWIAEEEKENATAAGYTVVDGPAALVTHLGEVIRAHAPELLGREEVTGLIENLKEQSPNLVEEVVPAVMKPGEVQKVLQGLLRESVSIRDLGTILETLGDWAPRSRDPEVLTEYVRNALSRSICRQHLARDGKLYVITLSPELEDLVRGAVERTERGSTLTLSPASIQQIGARIGEEIKRLADAGHAPVILCAPTVRAQVKKIADTVQPGITVLSYNEVLKDVRVETLGMVAVGAA